MSFDPAMVIVPEAADRAKMLKGEIEGRRQEIVDAEAVIAEKNTLIETHKMHIAVCQAGLQELHKAIPEEPAMAMKLPSPDAQSSVRPGY